MTKLAFGAALAALSLTIPAAAPAQRIGPAVVAVVDTDRVLSECTACRAAQTTLQTQLQQLQQRAQQLAQPLQTEAEAIRTATQGRQPDAATTQRIQALQTRQNSANQEIANRQRTLESTQAHVRQQIFTRLGPIINALMSSRGANVVVDRGATLASAPALDITNDVLAQLNQQLPSVSVTPLPQQQTQQPQQQQPQGR